MKASTPLSFPRLRAAEFFTVGFALASLAMPFLPKTLRAASPEVLPPVSAKELAAVKASLPERALVQPQEPRKVLVFWRCHTFFHKSIPVGNVAFELMGEKTGAYEVVTSDDMEMFTPERLAEFDAVLLNNTTRIDAIMTEAQRSALLSFIRGGKGLVGIHAATDNFQKWDEGAHMMGACFDGHPWSAGATVRVLNESPEHVLNQAFEGRDFTIQDEIYQFQDPYSRENLRVLLALDMYDEATLRQGKNLKRSDWDYPVAWLRTEGDGRVFYCSLGHRNETFANAKVMQHFLDGIQYALGDLAVEDFVPSSELFTIVDLEAALPELLAADDMDSLRAAERQAGILISRVLDKDAIAARLIAAMPDSSVAVQGALARLLVRSDSAAGMRAVNALLESNQALLRKAAVEALGTSLDKQAAGSLIGFAEASKDAAERSLALDAFVATAATHGDRIDMTLVDRALDVAQGQTSQKQILSLFASGQSAESLATVVSFLDDPELREPAMEIIVRMSNNWNLKTMFGDQTISALERVIELSSDAKVKQAAQQRIQDVERSKRR